MDTYMHISTLKCHFYLYFNQEWNVLTIIS